MAKKLSQMTLTEVQEEMSRAGSPEKIGKLGYEIWEKVASTIDAKNVAELINAQLALSWVSAQVKAEQRRYDKRTGQKTV